MRVRTELIAIALLVLATVVTVGTVLGAETYRRSTSYTVELTARAPEYGGWYPNRVTVRLGTEVRLFIRNIDTVSHGFALPDFQVAVPEIKAGETAIVQFQANKKGTFPFVCTVWCSDHHMQMRGELVVE